MIATMVMPFVFNLWFRKLLDAFEIIGGILHIILFIVFIVVLIVFGPRSSPDFVFNSLISDASGWQNAGVSWGLGLLTVTFSVSGYDSVLHMSKLLLSTTWVSCQASREFGHLNIDLSRLLSFAMS
jgi:choline transport protein